MEAKAPKRTTFEVKVSNMLKRENVLIQLQAELRYTQCLSSTNSNYKLQNNFDHKYSLHSESKSNDDAYSATDANASYKESKNSRSGSKISQKSASNVTNASIKGSYKLANVDANYSNQNETACLDRSSFHDSNHDINFNQNESSLSTKNAASDSHLNIVNNSKLNKLENQNASSFKTNLLNQTINPGFVRIVPLQTLSIPVVVESESQVVYLSVFVENNAFQCIANQFQVNVQHIQIVKKNGNIAIQPMMKESVGFRKKLKKWGIAESLIDCMEQCGWDEPRLWDDIRNEDLIKMGFKKGHINKFNNGYKEWKRINNWLYNDITYKALFEKWELPNFLYDNMMKAGWVNIKYWNKLSNDDLMQLGFEKGHIIIFKAETQNNKHIEEWLEIKKEFEQNKENNNDIKDGGDDYDDDDDEDIGKPKKPQFKIIYITHNSAHIELFSIIKSNEYYQVDICEKHENDENNLWNFVLKIKSGTGQKHKIKLDKMDTTYLIRIKCRNHQYDTHSDYTINSFKTQNKTWMIQHIGDIKNLNYKIDLINKEKINFILFQFDKQHISTLYKDDMDHNKYYIEVQKESDDEKNEWQQILSINDKQNIYLLNYPFITNQRYLFRIKSINNFQYIRYSKKIIKIIIVSQYYHPCRTRKEQKHYGGIDLYHPQATKNIACCSNCGDLNVFNMRFSHSNKDMMDGTIGNTSSLYCRACNKGYVSITRKQIFGCCMQSPNSSGCRQRYKCCNKRLNEAVEGCKTSYYYNCCNRTTNDKGCTQRYVCNTV